MKTYSGLLSLHSWGEADDILFLSSIKEPLAEELSWIARKNITVRYWTSDKPCSKEEAQEDFIKTLMGVGHSEFGSHYSEYTGYLWTDEELKVGGHNFLRELRSNKGRWVHIEIEENKPT